jgi:hypothetical protein
VGRVPVTSCLSACNRQEDYPAGLNLHIVGTKACSETVLRNAWAQALRVLMFLPFIKCTKRLAWPHPCETCIRRCGMPESVTTVFENSESLPIGIFTGRHSADSYHHQPSLLLSIFVFICFRAHTSRAIVLSIR